jgi:hypothetical protein
MTNEANQPAVMPAAAAYILTHRLPCAALMILLLMAAFWLPALLQGLPDILVILASTFGLGLHILAPGLIALITFGGGATFTIQVVTIASLGITALAGFSLLPGLIVLTVYGLLPILAAMAEMRTDGMRRSAQYLAFTLGGVVLIGIMAGASIQDMGLRELVASMLAPIFDGLQAQMPTDDPEAALMVEQIRQMTIGFFPGMVALGLWFVWWGDIVFARNIAVKFGFYQGSKSDLLELRFGKSLAYVFLALLALVNLGGGDVQYVAINTAILLGGLLAAQGIAVGHSWLKAKGMILAISLMYLILFIWSAMIIPFVIIGLLDIWFDYRRKIPAVGG